MSQVPSQLPACRRFSLLLKLVLTIVIFLGGVATGVGGYALWNEQRQTYNRQHPEEAPVRMADRIAKRLDLSVGQAEKVKTIIVEQWPAFQQIRNDMVPRMKAQMDQTRRQFEAMLTADQLKEWDKFNAEMTRSWELPARGPATTQPS